MLLFLDRVLLLCQQCFRLLIWMEFVNFVIFGLIDCKRLSDWIESVLRQKALFVLLYICFVFLTSFLTCFVSVNWLVDFVAPFGVNALRSKKNLGSSIALTPKFLSSSDGGIASPVRFLLRYCANPMLLPGTCSTEKWNGSNRSTHRVSLLC